MGKALALAVLLLSCLIGISAGDAIASQATPFDRASCLEWKKHVGNGIHHAAIAIPCANHFDTTDLRDGIADIAFNEFHKVRNSKEISDEYFRVLGTRTARLPSDWRAYIRTLALGWRFDKLRDLKSDADAKIWIGDQEFPDKLVDLPDSNGKDTVWRIDHESRSLIEQHFYTREQPVIAVVFSPTCGPCKRAVVAIQSDPELGPIFKKCSVWLGVVDQNFDLKTFSRWTHDNPEISTFLVRDWMSIGLDSPRFTPSFHLLVGGASIARVDGWPKSGNKAQILRALQKYNLYRTCRVGGD